MNIGFISTWFERGAAYVTKAYLDLLKHNNNVYIYARGGEEYAKDDPKWDLPFVTWGLKLSGTNINYHHFKKWILKNKIEVLFFNEQKKMDIVYRIKRNFPEIKIGTYIDYYKENTVKEFYLYDFLICNTKRHYSVFKKHPQCYYVPWGTDTDLFTPKENNNKIITFFHSVGMSKRKGTELLIEAFIDGKLNEKSKLIIHTQKNLQELFGFKISELSKYNIEIIQKTVSAPGLYYLGDIYVYPTTLDGLGLTLYEALASGIPVITTDNAPMNEVINNDVGYLVSVDYFRTRSDAYYWPLSICSKKSLIDAMNFFVNNKEKLPKYKLNARKEAIKKWNWNDRYNEINRIFKESKIIVKNPDPKLNDFSMKQKIKDKIGSSYLYHLTSYIR